MKDEYLVNIEQNIINGKFIEIEGIEAGKKAENEIDKFIKDIRNCNNNYEQIKETIKSHREVAKQSNNMTWKSIIDGYKVIFELEYGENYVHNLYKEIFII